MTREEAIQRFNGIINAMSISIAQSKFYPSKAELDELCDMAIEALQSTMNQERVNHESTNDLISRADAIEAMEARIKWFNGDAIEDRCKRDAFIQALDIITELPSAEAVHKPDYSYEANMVKRLRQAEAVQGWIPITESEPNTSDHVLVTYKWDDNDYETSELDYWVNKHEAEHGNERCQFFHDHIIAWQLKPAPYKGGDDEYDEET